MDNFSIRNPQEVLQVCSELRRLLSQISSVKDNLSDQKTMIVQNWNSETVDKNSYVAGLDKNINSLTALINAVTKCVNDSEFYAQRAIEISSNQVS